MEITDTRERILDVALDVLGQNPDAGMAEIASAAGVVRRTVYGYFPSRADLVHTLAQRAATEVGAVLADVASSGAAADVEWVDFVSRVWPLARRYRVLIVLRRSEYSTDIHAVLAPVEKMLADLVQRGQDAAVFGRHLPAPTLSQLAYASVFTIAETTGADERAATVTSLLLLGVPAARAETLAENRG